MAAIEETNLEHRGKGRRSVLGLTARVRLLERIGRLGHQDMGLSRAWLRMYGLDVYGQGWRGVVDGLVKDGLVECRYLKDGVFYFAVKKGATS